MHGYTWTPSNRSISLCVRHYSSRFHLTVYCARHIPYPPGIKISLSAIPFLSDAHRNSHRNSVITWTVTFPCIPKLWIQSLFTNGIHYTYVINSVLHARIQTWSIQILLTTLHDWSSHTHVVKEHYIFHAIQHWETSKRTIIVLYPAPFPYSLNWSNSITLNTSISI